MASDYVRYSHDVEAIDADEQQTFDRIVEVMGKGGEITHERYNHYVRVSHAKAHGFLTGELIVPDGLPSELAQGLFAQPRRLPVVVRMAHVPGETLDDRKVSTPRGMAIKIFEVDGEKIPLHQGQRTQDFVLDTGKAFNTRNAQTFLAAITATEAATPMPKGAKAVVSGPLAPLTPYSTRWPEQQEPGFLRPSKIAPSGRSLLFSATDPIWRVHRQTCHHSGHDGSAAIGRARLQH